MAGDYMGGTDDAKRDWMVNFSSVVGASAGTYFLSNADATAIAAAVDAYVDALVVARGESTRTTTTIALKNDCRDAAVAMCRQYAKLIKYNAGIDAPAKLAAGIQPPSTTSDPIECPLASPVVIPVAATNGAHTLGYKNSVDLTARAKPFGAVDLLLFRTIGTTPATNPDDAKFVGKFTKNPMAVVFDAADNGKIATYFARWSSRRGGVSNWSAPASMAIAA